MPPRSAGLQRLPVNEIAYREKPGSLSRAGHLDMERECLRMMRGSSSSSHLTMRRRTAAAPTRPAAASSAGAGTGMLNMANCMFDVKPLAEPATV